MPTNAPVSESVNGSPADAPTEPHDYAALNAVFAALLAGVVVAARERTRESEPLTTRDLAVTGAATFALAKVIARERIGTLGARAVRGRGARAPAPRHADAPRGRRAAHLHALRRRVERARARRPPADLAGHRPRRQRRARRVGDERLAPGLVQAAVREDERRPPRRSVALAAILDVDGTLVDTNYQHAIAWYRAFRQHDKIVPVWRIHRHIGMGGDQLVAALAGEEWDEEHGDDVRDRREGPVPGADRGGRAARGRARADRGPEGARPQRRAGQLGEGERGRPLPRPARRARARRRLDDLGRRRGHEARAGPRQGGDREGGRRATP